MIVVLLNVYLVLLFVLVKLKIVPFNLFWKISPVIVLLLLLVGLFIPMGWGAPQGAALVVRNSVRSCRTSPARSSTCRSRPNTPLKAGDVLFRIDPVPYQAQVEALEAQLKLQELRLAQMTQLAEHAAPAAPSTSSSARPRSTSSRRSSTARSGISTRPSCARRPTATSPISRCAKARASPTCRSRR